MVEYLYSVLRAVALTPSKMSTLRTPDYLCLVYGQNNFLEINIQGQGQVFCSLFCMTASFDPLLYKNEWMSQREVLHFPLHGDRVEVHLCKRLEQQRGEHADGFRSPAGAGSIQR